MASSAGGGSSYEGFSLGEWLVQPSLNRLSRGDETVQLRPKVMDVLVLLADHPGEVVTKDAIIDAVWAKEFIADSALSRAVFELRTALGDDPHAPTYVETIAKRGYRLVATVEPRTAELPPAAPAEVGRKDRWTKLAGGVGLAVAAGLLVTLGTPGRSPVRGPEVPKVLVLPFEYRGGVGGEFFADGLTEEITARLAAARDLTVMAPPAERRTRPGEAELARAGRELGASHVLWGTVQCQDDRVRIMVQLVTSQDGWISWADTFDRSIRDSLAVQQDVAAAVVERLGGALGLTLPDDGDAPGSRNVEAQQAYIRGVQHLRVGGRSGDGLAVGVRLLERAVGLDPQFAAAHAALASAHAQACRLTAGAVPEHCSEARESLQRARRLDPTAPQVRKAAADLACFCDRDFATALAEVREASRTPGQVYALVELEGEILRRQGRWSESTEVLERGVRDDADDACLRLELAHNYSLLGRHEDSLSCLEAAVALAPDDPAVYIGKADSLRRAGDLGKARATLDDLPRPGGVDAQLALYQQELAEGEFAAAATRARALLAQGAGAADPRATTALLVGQALWFAGERSEARRHFEAARVRAEDGLRAAPANSRLLQVLALSLAGLGQRADALSAGQRAVDAAPTDRDAMEAALALESLAEVEVMLGDADGAVNTLKRLLALPSRLSIEALGTDARWAGVRAGGRLESLRVAVP